MTYDGLAAVLFALLTIGIIGGAAGVVFLNRITGAALLMAFTFLCMAGMFVLLGAETIAAFQVLIYVGAITVLILYGVMFTPQRERPYALSNPGSNGCKYSRCSCGARRVSEGWRIRSLTRRALREPARCTVGAA